ncbi:MAG: hypothetical protein ACKVVT_14220 [Dehalococcoidia bacterium]
MAVETELKVQYLTDCDGKRTAVVIAIQDYEALLEDLEDAVDRALMAQRRDEPRMSHDEFVRQLKRDGLL